MGKARVKTLVVVLMIALALLAGCSERNPCEDNCAVHPASGECHCHDRCGTEGCQCHHSH
jgi:type IV pilus biogenesis protein CpaD/CtpE